MRRGTYLFRGQYVRALACAVMLALAVPVQAQPIPSTAEPGRAAKDLAPQPTPKASPEPIVPIRPGSVAPDQADKVTFTLKKIVPEGVTALPLARLSPLWAEDLGKTISVARLFAIVNAITNEYARAGYALSFALLPEQDITEGTVRIAVVEGFIDDIVIDGASASGTTALSLGGQVAAQVARLKASRPLKTADLERALLLLNDLPGVTARAVFAASKTTPNASTMTLSIARDSFSGTADVNNRMSDALGNWRAGGTLNLDGLLTDTTGVQLSAYRALDSGSFAYGAVSLSQPVSTDGLMLGLEGSYSRDVPLEGVLGSIDFEGESLNAGLSLAWPLIRSRPENLTLSAALRMSNTESTSLGTTLTQDRVRLIELAATWDVADRWSGLNLARLSLSQGLDIAGATDDASLFKSRANGSATFTSLGLTAVRQQGLTDQLSLYASVEAQAALGSPMLAASECSWGGQRGGRAYDAGVLSGDHCASGLVELRVDKTVGGFGLQLYGFADAAIVVQKGALEPGEKRHEQASSAGGGVRFFLDRNVSLNAEIAMPLRERYSDDGEEADPRAFFSATARF